MDTITLDSRFNGPPDSGNGGYSCGRLAAYIEGDATVRLHAPPPLDTPLTVRHQADGSVELMHGDDCVATARSAALTLEVPEVPSLDSAEQGRARFRCYENHPLPGCFVCGPGRPDEDGLALFTGPVEESQEDKGMVACPWQPAADLVDSDGIVRSEFVWAALDCPGSFAVLGDLSSLALLGEQSLSLRAPVPGDQTLIVFAWPIGGEGRKHYSGTAVATSDGRILAVAKTTWIVLRS